MAEKAAKTNKNELNFTTASLTKLAQADPKLAEQVYHYHIAAPAQQAFAKFQQNLPVVPKNGHTRMYSYVYFNDLKNIVNKTMKGTGLTWTQVPHRGAIITIPQLDNHGKPAFQLNYHKTHQIKTGYGKYARQKTVFDPLTNSNNEEVPIYTKGQVVSVTTIITYKNGYQLAHDSTSVVAQSTDPQDVGSALTYCSRYSLVIATGAGASDNDGQQQSSGSQVTSHSYPSYISNSQLTTLNTMIKKVANTHNSDPKTLQTYISQHFANYQPLNHMFPSRFNAAKSWLSSHMTK